MMVVVGELPGVAAGIVIDEYMETSLIGIKTALLIPMCSNTRMNPPYT